MLIRKWDVERGSVHLFIQFFLWFFGTLGICNYAELASLVTVSPVSSTNDSHSSICTRPKCWPCLWATPTLISCIRRDSTLYEIKKSLWMKTEVQMMRLDLSTVKFRYTPVFLHACGKPKCRTDEITMPSKRQVRGWYTGTTPSCTMRSPVVERWCCEKGVM